MKIGFIGLGIMGSRMAEHLIDGGHSLTIWNRSPERGKELEEKGATRASSPAEVGSRSDIVFTMLSEPEAVVETVIGSEGLLEGMKAGSLWVDCSTVHPTFSRQMAAEAEEVGVRMVDAPVSGSLKPAAAGELIFLVGGAADDAEEIRPLLDLMGKRTLHVGDHGMGSAMKLVVNMLMTTTMGAFAETVAFGRGLGLTQEDLLDFLIGGVAAPPYLAFKRENFEQDRYDPEFPLRLAHKDLQMASIAAYESGTPIPIASLVRELYQMQKQKEEEDVDFTAVFRGM